MTYLVVVVALLGGASVARTFFVPGQHHWWFNPALAVAVVAIGLATGLRAPDLGLAPGSAAAGARLGLAAMAVVAAGVAVLALLPATRDLLIDDRADVATAEMWYRALVVIPLGTVVVEELVFRGVVVGLLSRHLEATATVVAAAVIFGAWHVLPAWHGATSAELSSVDGPAVAAGATLVATTVAGAAFTWLRLRSGSLVAPALAHVATNSFTFVAAWWALRS